MKCKVGAGEIEMIQGDITKLVVDALVNAANEGLRGGGGVDGAIHRAGGPKIMEECRRIGRCPTGEAVVTTGGDLAARYVIHAVGPVWRGGEAGERALLAGAYRESLRRAEERRLKSVAFPSISTGAYGYPIQEASETALGTVLKYLKAGGRVNRIVFALFSPDDLEVYRRTLKTLTEY